MAGGNGAWHAAVPSWAKTLVFLVGGLGFPICVAGYFMAKDVGLLASPQARNEVTLGRMETTIGTAIGDMRVTVERNRIADLDAQRLDQQWKEKLLHVQVESCRAASRTEAQAQRCDYWRK